MTSAVTRWDPLNEFANMRSLMDRLMQQTLGRSGQMGSGEDLGTSQLNVDVVESGDAYTIKAAVPGVDPANVDISVQDDTLTIRGRSEQKEDIRDENYIRRELRYGFFERSLRLPPTADAEHAEATFDNGILTLRIPKKPEARARTIKITPQKAIQGEARAQMGQGQQGQTQPGQQGQQGQQQSRS